MRFKKKRELVVLVLVLTILTVSLCPDILQEIGARAITKDTRIGFGIGNLTLIPPSNDSTGTVENFNPEVQFTESSTHESIESEAKSTDNFPLLIALTLLVFTYCAALYVNRDLEHSEIFNMRINHQK